MKRKNCLSNKLLFFVLCFLIFTPSIFADVIRGRTEITEEDASPSVFPYQIKFANGTVTDNSDGTASVSSSGASTAASYVTTQAESGLSAEFNLGSLTTGLLKHSVSAGVSTPATAVAGTDYMNTTLASANIYVGNATNITTAVAMSGDIAIDNAGATTIQANSVALGTDTVNNYVATIADSGAAEVTVSGSGSETAAVTLAIGSTITRDIEWDTWAEHPALLSGQILVGNATNATANVTMSGDITINNTGVTQIGTGVVDANELAATAVTAGAYTLTNLTVDADGRITTIANGTTSGANTALSNLASVAINTGLVSDTTLIDDLGTSSINWRDLYTGGIVGKYSFDNSLDSSTTFLLHSNGVDASTTLIDELGKIITANGNCQIDTAQSKFGGASGLYDGTGDYLTTPDHADWNFGTGDFTIDFWVRFNSISGTKKHTIYYQQTTDSSDCIWIFLESGVEIGLRIYAATVLVVSVEKAWVPSANTWYHVALTRSGNSWKWFIDGTQVGTTVTDADAVADYTGVLNIGTGNLGASVIEFNGWLDEFRISKGVARWTADFTLPTSEYGTIKTSKIGIGQSPAIGKLDILGDDSGTAMVVKINAAQASVTAADTFIDFRSTTGSEGSIAGTASGGVIAYNTFTGSHYTYIIDKTGLEPNILLEIVDEDILTSDWNNEAIKYTEKEKLKDVNGNDLKDAEGNILTKNVEKVRIIKHEASPKGQLFKSRICQNKGSKAAVGVYGGTDRENRDLVLSIGTGFMFVANKGVNIAVGDYLISSDVAGCAELQTDDIQRSNTVAKATESITWAQGEAKRLIRVVYLGG